MPKDISSDQLELWKTKYPDSKNEDTLFSRLQLDEISSRRSNFGTDVPTPQKTAKLLDTSFALKRPLNILVADDNEINRKVIRVILQKLGYNCVEAINGEEAYKHYNSGEYDYVFMDLDMPEMNGIQAAQAIRNLEKQIETDTNAKEAEIIAVTANVSDDTRLQCRRAGMNGYLEKPITASMIKDQLLRSWPRIRTRRGK